MNKKTVEELVQECAGQKRIDFQTIIGSERWDVLVDGFLLEARVTLIVWLVMLLTAIGFAIFAVRKEQKVLEKTREYGKGTPHMWVYVPSMLLILVLLGYGLIRGSDHVVTIFNPEKTALKAVAKLL